MDPQRRRALDTARLTALVSDRSPGTLRELFSFAGGVALVGDDDVWVLPVDGRRLGAVLAWTATHAPDRAVDLVADDAGLAARRAPGFDPTLTVWGIEGRSLVPAQPAPRAPSTAPPEAPELVSVLEQAGLEIVTEHGVTTGEVKGLEIARIIDGEPRPHLLIGVGVYDQGAFSALHADRTLDGTEDPGRLVADLVAVRDRILAHRGAGPDPHAANRLVRPRWLRSTAMDDPARIGLSTLTAVEPPEPRGGLNTHAQAAAVGRRDDGADVLAVFSVGVDTEMVPVAADLLADHDVAEVRLVLPERDHHPVIARAATRLRVDASVVALEGEWSEPAPSYAADDV